MKNILITLTCSFILFVSCEKPTTTNPINYNSKKLEGINPNFANQANAFAFKCFQQLNSTQSNENVVISPLSIDIALGMLLNGADGETANEIKKALQKEGFSLEQLNITYNQLIKGLPIVDPKVRLSIANSVWKEKNFQTKKTFTDMLFNNFDAETNMFDINNKKESISSINKWVAINTENKIPTIIEAIPDEAVMYLINALYFKGDWKYKFDPKNTVSSPFFTTIDKRARTTNLMKQKVKLRTTQSDNYAAFELPYGNGDYNMTIVLPDNDVSIEKFANEFNLQNWQSLQNNLKESTEDIALPKFTLDYKTSLNATLKSLGMKIAFTDKANLSKISDANGLSVFDVAHKVNISVDEAGSEAAAVTSIGVGVTSVPLRNYIVNRAFMIFITEKTSNTVLFIGKIADLG